MNKRIIVKEVDKLLSALHKDRVVTEYLIYLMFEGETVPLEAYTEFGDSAKSARVNELILTNFISEDSTNTNIDIKEIIEEVTFKEYSKQLKKIWKK